MFKRVKNLTPYITHCYNQLCKILVDSIGLPTNIWRSIESINDPCAETLAGPMGHSDIIGGKSYQS